MSEIKAPTTRSREMVRNRSLIDEAARRVAENLRYQQRVERDRQWRAVAEMARRLQSLTKRL